MDVSIVYGGGGSEFKAINLREMELPWVLVMAQFLRQWAYVTSFSFCLYLLFR